MRKLWRFFLIYGFFRTMVKVAGRTRWIFLKFFFKGFYVRKKRLISLIGCGQFGFSTISYFLQKEKGNCFLNCYDIDVNKAKTTAAFWGFDATENIQDLIDNPRCKYVYIASDHYTHSLYAIEALNKGKIVYLEKPLAVTKPQFQELLKTIENTRQPLYAGYNRPYSKAIQKLTTYLMNKYKPITLSCFVSGHKIEVDHWYRDPKEGTRVCGNIGHWLDLSMYLFNKRGYIPCCYEINIIQSDSAEPDDNLTISYKTDYHDLVTITLTSRSEPFEGINETINFQCDDIISKIDDFRNQQIWINNKFHKYKYSPKDVGHKRSILQPFMNDNRDWEEVVYSTCLMLKIKDMVLSQQDSCLYNILEDIKSL